MLGRWRRLFPVFPGGGFPVYDGRGRASHCSPLMFGLWIILLSVVVWGGFASNLAGFCHTDERWPVGVGPPLRPAHTHRCSARQERSRDEKLSGEERSGARVSQRISPFARKIHLWHLHRCVVRPKMAVPSDLSCLPQTRARLTICHLAVGNC